MLRKIIIALVGLVSIPSGEVAAAPVIQNLGTTGGSLSYGTAINAVGQVAGSSESMNGGVLRPFLFSGIPGMGGLMIELTPNGAEGRSAAVNDVGHVAGYTLVGGNWHAFVYGGTPNVDGALLDLGTLGGRNSQGFAINNSGQVAGTSQLRNDAAFRAFRYTGTPGLNGAMVDLGTLGGTHSSASDINFVGQVVGRAFTAGNAAEHAFVYTGTPGEDGLMTDLGTLGGRDSLATAINDAGQITGYSELDVADDTAHHAFLSTPGTRSSMADLGTLGGDRSDGKDINAAGHVVGYSQIADGSIHAFLYTGTPGADGVMIDLDAWLDLASPTDGASWTLYTAEGINDSGLITGYGYYDDGVGGLSDGGRAFLLDANSLIPEPGLLTILPIGLTICRRVRYRRH